MADLELRTDLELRLLGNLQVLRGGQMQGLPPSRKTRALLAYLALNDRAFRREQLCELLWEIPDDPRGSLRWSLSKLRRIVDDGDKARIIADRTHVRFDTSDVSVDVSRLRELADRAGSRASLESLEAAAASFGGNLLEGLELTNFHEFHAWCVAERELAARAQVAVYGALVGRLRDEPERALPYARSLVAVSPYDEAARATLIELLVTLGLTDDAEQQYRLGSMMLKEAGAEPTGTLRRALRGRTKSPPASVAATDARRETVDLTGPSRASRESRPTLVGRDAELGQLEATLASAARDRCAHFVLIRGEAGLGKSRLLDSAAQLARDAGASLLESAAFESEAIRPFALWIDALRRDAPEAARAIFDGSEHDNRDRLFAGLSELVASESETRPLVLLFDDLQWCDESSAAALHYVARTNRQRPLVGILAARAGELRDNTAMQQAVRGLAAAGLMTELRLAPLSESAVQRLIDLEAPSADGEQISRDCAGNPLIALELARAELAGDSGSSLGELMRERLGRLDVDQAEVLRWAAVLAPRVSVQALERVADPGAHRIGAALEAAERQAMLQATENGFRFSHDLVARSIYNDISPSRRRMMHRRVAELLEKDTTLDLERASDLARHAALSGDASLAARAMVSAGRLSLRFFANEEALTLARKGLQLVDKLADAERVCLTLELHDVMLAAAPLEDWESAAAEYVALAEQALDHGALSHARLGYYMASYVRWMHGHWTGARDVILQSERVSRGGSDEEHVVGMAEAARCLALLERDLTHAEAMLMEAQALASRVRVNHYAIPAALGMLRLHENRLDEAEELFQEARTLAKSSGDRINEFQANEFMIMIDVERGDYDAARRRCAALIEIGSKLREGSEAPFARALEALCTYALEDDAKLLDTALQELRVVDAKQRLAYSLLRAALIDLERGRNEQAVTRATEALSHAQVLDRATEMLLAHAVLARAHEAADDSNGYERHVGAIAELDSALVAEWARSRTRTMTGLKGKDE